MDLHKLKARVLLCTAVTSKLTVVGCCVPPAERGGRQVCRATRSLQAADPTEAEPSGSEVPGTMKPAPSLANERSCRPGQRRDGTQRGGAAQTGRGGLGLCATSGPESACCSDAPRAAGQDRSSAWGPVLLQAAAGKKRRMCFRFHTTKMKTTERMFSLLSPCVMKAGWSNIHKPPCPG